MSTASVNGTELYYEQAGIGHNLLFVHGMCGHADVWQDQMRRLSPRFRCTAYDRRGHTRSPLGDVAQRSVELHADDAAGLIRALALAPCLLVGSSGGARVGVDVVRRYPELLSGAILSEPPLFALEPQGAEAMIAELKPKIEQAVDASGPRAAVDAFFEYMCPGLWEIIDELRKDTYRDNSAELFGDLQMPPYQISAEDLKAIGVRCRIISGDQSLPLLRRIAKTLAENIPRATFVELQRSGHVTYAEQPERFVQTVEDFANRLGVLPAG